MRFVLTRTDKTEKSTIGDLTLDSKHICYMLEPPEKTPKGKVIPVCIPVGLYQIQNTHSNRFNRTMPQLMNVPGRSGIRIHTGNSAVDTEGCLLPGFDKGPNYVGSSRRAVDEVYRLIAAGLQHDPDDVWIEVRNHV
jgi:hypothetical protein